MNNLGLLYNKEIFNHLQLDLKGNEKNKKNKKNKHFYFPDKEIEEKDNNGRKYKKVTPFGDFLNKIMKEIKLANIKPWAFSHEKNKNFELETVYPGLLCGSGYAHEIGQNIDEFQLGFYFDHTTGLPVIPASSVKGVLRYACEVNNGEYLKQKLTDLKIETSSYFTAIVTKNKKGKEVVNPSEFVYNIFEGKLLKKDEQGQVKCDEDGKPITKQNVSIYERDIFLEVVPVHSKGALFGNDYITHHAHPLKNPVPVQFMRINGQVSYQFNFNLKDSNSITAEQKKMLFKQIILDLGLGAKTNVGYGQFVESNSNSTTTKRPHKAYMPCSNAIKYKKNETIEVEIIQDGEYFAFKDEQGSVFVKSEKNINKKFETDLNRKRKKNPDLKFKPLALGMIVKIQFKQDVTNDINFTLIPIVVE